MATDRHWTDNHIRQDEKTKEWIGYDEVALELIRDKDREVVRRCLIEYAEQLNS